MKRYLFVGGPAHGTYMDVESHQHSVDIHSPRPVNIHAGYYTDALPALDDMAIPYRTTRYRLVTAYGRAFMARADVPDWQAVDDLRQLLLELWGKGKLDVPSTS